MAGYDQKSEIADAMIEFVDLDSILLLPIPSED